MEFDYIIVGEGSAGCVLAARLSDAPRHTVSLGAGGGNSEDMARKRALSPAPVV